MSTLIHTHNAYLKIALQNLVSSTHIRENIIFIDLRSFRGLTDILELLNSGIVRADARVCLIGYGCINVLLLRAFKPLRMDESVNQIRTWIVSGCLPKAGDISAFIISIQKLAMMSEREWAFLMALKNDANIKTTSIRLGVSEKITYATIRNAGNKINLTKLIRVREFLSSTSFTSWVC